MDDIIKIEHDVEEIENKCNKIQCNGVYDAINAVIKLIVDLFKCFKPKNI
jgi:hypothetical protein